MTTLALTPLFAYTGRYNTGPSDWEYGLWTETPGGRGGGGGGSPRLIATPTDRRVARCKGQGFSR